MLVYSDAFEVCEIFNNHCFCKFNFIAACFGERILVNIWRSIFDDKNLVAYTYRPDLFNYFKHKSTFEAWTDGVSSHAELSCYESTFK